MDRASGPGPRAPEHLRWDIDGMATHSCTLARANAGPSEIVLSFGSRERRDDQGLEIGPALASRIALSPLTARNLAATLRRLIDENDGAGR